MEVGPSSGSLLVRGDAGHEQPSAPSPQVAHSSPACKPVYEEVQSSTITHKLRDSCDHSDDDGNDQATTDDCCSLDLSVHSCKDTPPRTVLPGAGLTTSMTLHGLVLDGKQGIPEAALKNLGALVKHMTKHRDDDAMQAQCCLYLVNYASFQDSSKQRAARAGAVPAVLHIFRRTMGQHGDRDGTLKTVIELALWTLNTLCGLKSIAVEAMHAGAIKLVIQAMAALPAAVGVQEQGCWFLTAAAGLSKDVRKKVKACGGEACVAAAVAAHQGQESCRVAALADEFLKVMSSQTREKSPVQAQAKRGIFSMFRSA